MGWEGLCDLRLVSSFFREILFWDVGEGLVVFRR
jgi:hypothetical protein